MKLFAFDRDNTIDVNQGPVPLSWVRYLAEETEHEVYAIGNQALKKEAGIPGVAEAQEKLKSKEDVGKGTHVGMPARRERVRMLKELFPSKGEYIVIDDADLSNMEDEGWTYYSPDDFVREYKWKFRLVR